MMHLVKTVLSKIANVRWKRRYDAQRRATDTMVAELKAVVAELKRSHVAKLERSETQPSLDEIQRSYIYPAERRAWRETYRAETAERLLRNTNEK